MASSPVLRRRRPQLLETTTAYLGLSVSLSTTHLHIDSRSISSLQWRCQCNKTDSTQHLPTALTPHNPPNGTAFLQQPTYGSDHPCPIQLIPFTLRYTILTLLLAVENMSKVIFLFKVLNSAGIDLHQARENSTENSTAEDDTPTE